MSHTLLLADDSVTTQRVLELTFAEHGVRVVGVTDGEQALERLKAERPDIVLVDVGLAKVNGYKLAAHITQQPSLAGIPVLLLVGAFDSVDEERVTQSGAAGTLVKPLESSIVIKRVKELLGLAGNERTTAPPGGRRVTASEPPPQRPPTGPRGVGPPAPNPDAPAGDPSIPVTTMPWEELQSPTGVAPSTEPAEGEQDGGDYFDHLDAAFDSLDAQLAGRSLQRPAVRPAPADSRPIEPAPPRTAVPAAHEATVQTPAPVAPEYRATPAAPTAPVVPVAPSYGVADAFENLLAAEQGETPPVHASTIEISDEVVERIAVRVAERLTEGVLIDAVRDIVGAVAERLVTEEIARIRAAAEAKRK